MADETGDTGGSKRVKVSGRIETTFPPEFVEKYNAGQQQEHTRESHRFRAEIATLIVLLAYTCVAFWQGCSSQKSASAAKSAADTANATLTKSEDQFRQEYRPYIGETARSTQSPVWYQNPTDKTEGQILWKWSMTNYGKSPNHDVTFTQEMKLAGQDWKLSNGEKGLDFGAPLPPGQDSFDEVISERMLEKDYDKLLRITDGISIRIKINYLGPDEAKYETGLCLSRTNAGSITYCKEDNYIK